MSCVAILEPPFDSFSTKVSFNNAVVYFCTNSTDCMKQKLLPLDNDMTVK